MAELAERLRRAEREYQAAQCEHDGTDRATERYGAACRELLTCDRIARAVLCFRFRIGRRRQVARLARRPDASWCRNGIVGGRASFLR